MLRMLVLVMATLLVAACASKYTYAPVTGATTMMQGRPAADYAIPPAQSSGDAEIASFGLTRVAGRTDPDRSFAALHVRVLLRNNSATQWTFDTRDQRIDLDHFGLVAPAFASANAGSPPPLVTVPASGKRVVDLFFLLPPSFQRAEEIPEFDAVWRVNDGAQVVAERTPFARLLVEPVYDAWSDYGDDYYWEGPYWVNPAFPHADVSAEYFGPGMSIRRAPHFWRSGTPHGGQGASRDGRR